MEATTKHNILGLTKNGSPMAFESVEHCYWYVFQYLIVRCTRGYIDIILLLHALYEWNIAECNRKLREMRLEKQYLELDFYHFGREVCKELEALFKGLHRLQGTEFQELVFTNCYNIFVQFMTEC